MARPKKTGLEYFPFDVDFFDDEKIVAIAGEFGIKGEMTAIKLLCAVYRNGYFIEWTEMLKMKMMKSLPGVSAELLEQIVNRLVKWGFFDKTLFDSVRILTSRGIQRRFLNISKRRTKTDRKPYWLISATETTAQEGFLHTETTLQQGFLHTETPQSKVKESKEKPIPTDVGIGQKKDNDAPATAADRLASEIDEMRRSEVWLYNLQALHHRTIDQLRRLLDDFELACRADGRTGHDSLADAQSHFNRWLRFADGTRRGQNDDTHGQKDTYCRQYGTPTRADRRREAIDSRRRGIMEELAAARGYPAVIDTGTGHMEDEG